MSRLPSLPALALLCALVCGCGRESDITVRFEEAPPPPPPSAPAPPAPAAPPPPAPPAPKPALPKPPQPPKRVPHAVAIFFDGAFPSVQISMTPTSTLTGAVAVQETASRDGLGTGGKLGALLPGQYQLELTTPQLGSSYPMLVATVTVDGHTGTSVILGWVQFKVPPAMAEQAGKGIHVEFLEQPANRRIFKGPLGKLEMLAANGAKHGRTLVLPLGTYSYALTDLDASDRVSIAGAAGRPGLIVPGEKNSFTLSSSRTSTIVDLSQAIVVK